MNNLLRNRLLITALFLMLTQATIYRPVNSFGTAETELGLRNAEAKGAYSVLFSMLSGGVGAGSELYRRFVQWRLGDKYDREKDELLEPDNERDQGLYEDLKGAQKVRNIALGTSAASLLGTIYYAYQASKLRDHAGNSQSNQLLGEPGYREETAYSPLSVLREIDRLGGFGGADNHVRPDAEWHTFFNQKQITPEDMFGLMVRMREVLQAEESKPSMLTTMALTSLREGHDRVAGVLGALSAASHMSGAFDDAKRKKILVVLNKAIPLCERAYSLKHTDFLDNPTSDQVLLSQDALNQRVQKLVSDYDLSIARVLKKVEDKKSTYHSTLRKFRINLAKHLSEHDGHIEKDDIRKFVDAHKSLKTIIVHSDLDQLIKQLMFHWRAYQNGSRDKTFREYLKNTNLVKNIFIESLKARALLDIFLKDLGYSEQEARKVRDGIREKFSFAADSYSPYVETVKALRQLLDTQSIQKDFPRYSVENENKVTDFVRDKVYGNLLTRHATSRALYQTDYNLLNRAQIFDRLYNHVYPT